MVRTIELFDFTPQSKQSTVEDLNKDLHEKGFLCIRFKNPFKERIEEKLRGSFAHSVDCASDNPQRRNDDVFITPHLSSEDQENRDTVERFLTHYLKKRESEENGRYQIVHALQVQTPPVAGGELSITTGGPMQAGMVLLTVPALNKTKETDYVRDETIMVSVTLPERVYSCRLPNRAVENVEMRDQAVGVTVAKTVALWPGHGLLMFRGTVFAVHASNLNNYVTLYTLVRGGVKLKTHEVPYGETSMDTRPEVCKEMQNNVATVLPATTKTSSSPTKFLDALQSPPRAEVTQCKEKAPSLSSLYSAGFLSTRIVHNRDSCTAYVNSSGILHYGSAEIPVRQKPAGNEMHVEDDEDEVE